MSMTYAIGIVDLPQSAHATSLRPWDMAAGLPSRSSSGLRFSFGIPKKGGMKFKKANSIYSLLPLVSEVSCSAAPFLPFFAFFFPPSQRVEPHFVHLIEA